MKKLSLFLSAMLISMMSFAGTVTFEVGQDKLEGHTQGTPAVMTKDGVTLDVSKGAFGRDDNFRIYAGFGVTISCEYGNITGVEITCTTEQYAPSNLTTTVGTFTCDGLIGTWTGDEASVAFSATKQVRFTKLVVTYESADANFVDQPMITGDVNFADTANVVITAEEGMKIYYTLDGTDPTTASTEYTAPFEVYATTTVKAIAYNEATAVSSLITTTAFTQATKVPCAQAAAIAKALSDNVETTELYYCVKGYVTSIKDTLNTSTSVQQFWIADTKTGGEVLYAYNNQVPCAMEVGMKVRIVGRLKQWNTGQEIQPHIVNAKITVLAPAPKIYTVSATAENGTVEGAGQYEEGAQATLTATAAEGYEFVNWTVDGTEVSTENPYKFNVTADVALVANFQEAVAVTTKEEKSACPAGTLVDGKVIHELESCTIVQEQGESTTALKSVSPWQAPAKSIMTITPKEGVTIQQYIVNTKNTTLGTYIGKSELTNATKTATNNGLVTFTVTNGTEPVVMKFVSTTIKFCELTIIYTVAGGTTDPEPMKYTVTVKAENGTVEGAGEYEEGALATLTASANKGYEFTCWTVGEDTVSTKNPYKFNVTADVEVVANFQEAAVVEPTTETVYFINNKSWSKVNAYAWEPVQNANWPGVAATKEAEQIGGYDVYSFTAEAGQYANVIFNNGSGQQTADLKWTAGKYVINNQWYTKEEAEAQLVKPVEYEYVYFVDNQGWGKANIYTWTPEVGTWPGVAMTKEAEQLAGYDVYSYKAEKGTSFGGIIFNNGSGVQTGDLKWTAGKYYVKDAWYTKEEAIEKLSAPVTPPVITYVLMGVKGDWTTGIALTVNPDNENEYMLLGQEILEGDAVKVVTLTDGVATAWCGNVDEYSVERSYDENGNIVLAPGKYDFYFKVKEDLIYIGGEAYKETITWELNGGEFPAVVVPTNAELWEAFKPYYNTYYGLNRADQPIDKVSTFANAKMQEIMTDEASEYKWLGDYVLSVATAAGVTLSTDMASANESGWRWAVHAFFNAAEGQYGAAGINFTEAGKQEVWGAAYEAEYGVVLPTEAMDEDYVLPTPVKEGYTFVGWYDNAEGTGEAMTVLPAGWAGTIYAIWKQEPTTGVDNTIVTEQPVKIVRNGQLLILVGDSVFNVMGQQMK